MRSRSTSHSEGEYLGSDTETKATKSLSHRNDYHVNRHVRHLSSARPRRSRSRSRSPYRAPPRGEKRRRDIDQGPIRDDDTRTFQVRYEDSKKAENYTHGDRKSKRSRTFSPGRSRSRSPYRHNKSLDEPEEESQNRQSVSAQNHKRDGVTRLENVAKTVEQSHDSESTTAKSHDDNADVSAPAILDEAAVIEARRRRREAIKNQYRGQAPPLLVQALHLGPDTSANSSNATPNRSVSPPSVSLSTPGTPAADPVSEPQSPAIVNLDKDEDIANENMFGSPKTADEPSAADYDPTADMQEERLRHDKRLFKEDESSEVKADQKVIEQIEQRDEPVKRKMPELDMFAEEDDEDDMFAETPATRPKAAEKSAKALDVTMMDNWDDVEGYYLTILGELIDGRYQVTANLGRGMFASVVRATDTKSNNPVAIKIVRSNESMRKAGMKEVDILKDLAANDPDDRKHVVRLLRSFDHKGHLCMVFENMSMNLREVLKKFGRDVGINLKAIRAYAQQLFLGLSLMKKCQYLHADMKPDNILVNEGRNIVKIADLGSASPITENATAPYLVSRFYRAPEIILGIEYDYGIDMWSLGCTLFELYTGKILFTGRNNNNMLRNIMECRGKFPHKILRKGTLTYEYFDDLLNFRSQEQDKITGRIVTKIIDIKAKPVRDLRSRLIPKDKRFSEQERKELESFVDLLEKCLDLRPDKRITPVDALKHPFVTRTVK